MKTAVSKKLGTYLRTRRTNLGLSQKQVAKYLGYPNIQSISNWERGKTLPPVKKLKKISTLYKLSKSELISLMLFEIESHIRQSF